MKPLAVASASFVVAYGGCLILLALAAGAAPGGGAIPFGASFAWHAWYASAAVCLSATAVDLVVGAAWVWLRVSGAAAGGGVPLRLSAIDRARLLREYPSVALLMPAHNEASTEADREALVNRIHETVLRTPSYAKLFLLADSPPSQRGNEVTVVRRVRERLRASGFEYLAGRVVLEEYRDKPPGLRHKCGSLLMWLRGHGRQFQYMFILDADSSLPAPDPRRPETCEPIERMLVAMNDDPGLALVQASIQIRGYRTAWGWLQAVNTRVGANYYLRVFSYLYGRTSPCYGHNCMLRVSDFATHVRNTLAYTSHDHIDSADLAAAGRGCVLTDAVVTYEEPEDTLPGWLKRECRWSRGNGQWLTYLLRKRGLPAGAAVYLGLGIMQYVWALLAGTLLISAAVLSWYAVPMVTRPDSPASYVLTGLVLLTLVVPKLAATRTLAQVVAGLVSSVLLGPTLAMFQGVCFVLGAFGSKWVPRGARSSGFGPGEATGIVATFFPSMLLGLVLWRFIGETVPSAGGGGMLLVAVMVVGMILSPLTGLLLSVPVGRRIGALTPAQE
jgi:membrane glycosyltransferase